MQSARTDELTSLEDVVKGGLTLDHAVPAESEPTKQGREGPQRLRWDDLVPSRVRRAAYALLSEPGRTDFRSRRNIVDYAMSPDDVDLAAAIPATIHPYVDSVVNDAAAISDDDVDRLRQSGLSEDHIFEITLCAGVGAALGRFEAGLRALHDAGPVD